MGRNYVGVAMATYWEAPQNAAADGHGSHGTFGASPPSMASQTAAPMPLDQLPPPGGWQDHPVPATPPPPVPYGAIYCRGCGTPVHPQAALCTHCGVPTGVSLAPLRHANPKVKSTAVVLVVLFGLFGWLYTYQRDAWKFWVNLGLAVVTLGFWGIAAWVWAIIDVSVKPSEWYAGFPNA
jgi:hypothetical protein